MSTTTIRLDDDFKQRLTAAAARTGRTAHAFILEAVAQQVERCEQEAAFHHVAQQRWATLVAGGPSLSLADAEAHLAQRVRAQTKG
ncbi:ribbon-helix-helix protein, CopG family [Inhella gelatinilytica]|uniref:Ribbon-helix-helix protein, CopG family n=1 Tax=Inhella gelatinilytica TaxID=2795030 RepID=A0A931IUW9_9BURK|nr:ribbon-helix-helix protein, CopG family [Inhella gelatinilytica]MBH9551996.1 ribbon-helix-helix protein, CopG family [Inhella gelatinilytica]